MFEEESKVGVRLNKVFAVITLLLLFTIILPAQTPGHKVKSLLITEIANRHVKWPKEVGMDKKDKPFVMGVVGESSFGKFLGQIYNGKPQATKIKNKTVIIRSVKRVEQIPGCQLLFFVPELPRRFFTRVMDSIRDKPILTIADTEDYIDQGVHISFVVEKTPEKPVTGLVINETISLQSGLLMDKDLFNMAKAIVQPYRPYQDKAINMERFTRFIDWPPGSAQTDPSKPFKIEVLGQNFFDSYLEEVLKGTSIKNKPVVIRFISKINEIGNPHLLFISKSMKDKISEIMAYIKNKPILTIGDTPGFYQAGVHINFYEIRYTLYFEINDDAATAAGLNISYHLLQRAKLDTSH